MGQASEKIKEIANIVAEDNNNDGVAKTLENIITKMQ